ncbi:uncharacterized protein G2W53_026192 [Senna tora]|uniref:Uncharacterized protein n=1 Tax=Senna tora TaxID=362788 RepID=A0A834TEL3_9FABA|nr:uncharacterized protein G2W53_026192 [Senna tora]
MKATLLISMQAKTFWGDFGSIENFNQQPLTDFCNIINQCPFQQVPEFMSIPPYMLAQYRQEEQKVFSLFNYFITSFDRNFNLFNS